MKFLLLLACGLTLVWRKSEGTPNEINEKEEFDTNVVQTMLMRLRQLEAENEQQRNEMRALRGENKKHQYEIERQARIVERQAQEIDRQAHKIHVDDLSNNDNHQREVLNKQQQQIKTIEVKVDKGEAAIDLLEHAPTIRASHKLSRTPEPETRSQFTAFTCTTANISLSCPTNRSILVTTGNYGQYGIACSSTCCPPNPQYDCTEVIEENSPQDWLAIQAICDGQQSCEFPNLGTTISQCEAGYLSDYMQLFYDCLPDDETGPVAFTAWANTGNPTEYISGDVIMFNFVLSNFGGHYNPATSSFICPVDGVYLLSVSIMTAFSDAFVSILMRNNIILARVNGDNISNVYNHAGTTVVTECSRGEALWVGAGSTGSMYGQSQYSVFTGHLIQSL